MLSQVSKQLNDIKCVEFLHLVPDQSKAFTADLQNQYSGHIQIHDTKPAKCTNLFLRYIYHKIIIILTPWSRVLLEKLTGFQLVKKFSAFHGT